MALCGCPERGRTEAVSLSSVRCLSLLCCCWSWGEFDAYVRTSSSEHGEHIGTAVEAGIPEGCVADVHIRAGAKALGCLPSLLDHAKVAWIAAHLW